MLPHDQTLRLTAPGRPATGALRLTVLGPDGTVSQHALPAEGALCIGRGEAADVRIDVVRTDRMAALLVPEA